MGKLEKGIVLAVLFLVAVILGVALNSEPGVAEAASGPLSKPETRSLGAKELAQGGRPPVSQPRAERKAPRAQRLLVSETERQEKPALPPAATVTLPAEPQPEPAVEPLPPAPEPEPTRSLAGLEATPVEGLMLYTWRAGDTYASVAESYLGADKTRTLAKANEGRAEASLRVGDQIFVPVDLEQTASSTVYVVESGDVLGTISQKVYGTSKKWRQIYDANRDVLPDANALKVGQTLRIPAK